MGVKQAAEAPAGTFARRFGLAIIVGFLTASVIGLTILVPPWAEVHCRRRQILYWSERHEVRSRSFAGFDVVWSRAKRQRESTPPNPSSDTYFESKEYDVWWPLLVAEWCVAVAGAFGTYVVLVRRYASGADAASVV